MSIVDSLNPTSRAIVNFFLREFDRMTENPNANRSVRSTIRNELKQIDPNISDEVIDRVVLLVWSHTNQVIETYYPLVAVHTQNKEIPTKTMMSSGEN